MIEKFEVKKGDLTLYYTGTLTKLKDGRVEINTVRGETLRFWENQIMGSKEMKRDEIKQT